MGVRTSVFIGIDVACAVGKRLPLYVVAAGCPLSPLGIPREYAGRIPRGVGNQEIIAPRPFEKSAHDVAKAIKFIGDQLGWKIERIAVDAPAAPPAHGSRSSEKELQCMRLSSFKTPAVGDWPGILSRCEEHLSRGRPLVKLPHANKIWMLFGFKLFESLRSELRADVIEVYPYAIVRALLEKCEHKTTEKGYRDQLAAVAHRTGWEPQALETKLKETVAGSRHDRLDAFMAAWVASLPPNERRAYGDATRADDAIWAPL